MITIILIFSSILIVLYYITVVLTLIGTEDPIYPNFEFKYKREFLLALIPFQLVFMLFYNKYKSLK
jgi:hypothetical protein